MNRLTFTTAIGAQVVVRAVLVVRFMWFGLGDGLGA